MDRQSRIIRYMLLSLLLLASSVVATATAERVVVTSGRVVYDAFGRAVATYHPTVATDSVYDFSAAIDTVPPTVTEYDVLDRPTRVIYPDGTKTNTSYSVAGHALVTHVTDALDNESETHVSGSGRTVKSTSKEPSLFSFFDICPCCGVEFGNEDYTEESLKEYRAKWISEGAHWFDPKLQPQNWSMQEQISNISLHSEDSHIAE